MTSPTKPTQTILSPAPPPRWIQKSVLALSAIAVVSGAFGIAQTFAGTDRWLSLGFEGMIVLAGVFGILAGLGRFRAGPALAVVCVAGVVFVAGALSEPDFLAKFKGSSGRGGAVLVGVNTMHLAAFRVLLSMILGGFAGLVVIVRAPERSAGYLVRGIACSVPVIASLGVAAMPGLRGKVLGAITGLPGVATLAAVLVLFFVLGSLLAASIHLLIRAFEVGVEAADVPRTPKAETSPNAS